MCHLRKAKKLTEVLNAKDYLVEIGFHSNAARLFLKFSSNELANSLNAGREDN